MTATNIFYNFVGFRYSPPLIGIEGSGETWDISRNIGVT